MSLSAEQKQGEHADTHNVTCICSGQLTMYFNFRTYTLLFPPQHPCIWMKLCSGTSIIQCYMYDCSLLCSCFRALWGASGFVAKTSSMGSSELQL